MVRRPPKLVCTKTPTVKPPSFSGRWRELVPIPPFHPKAMVPVPAPTEPSSTGPPPLELEEASLIARATLSALT